MDEYENLTTLVKTKISAALAQYRAEICLRQSGMKPTTLAENNSQHVHSKFILNEYPVFIISKKGGHANDCEIAVPTECLTRKNYAQLVSMIYNVFALPKGEIVELLPIPPGNGFLSKIARDVKHMLQPAV
jgi:hypothetical protein